jgi:hypothetical protein
MLPSELKVEQFAGYPPQGRKRAEENLALLRQLPLGFVPFLFKELIGYDWKFPAERSDLDHQLVYLNNMPAEKRRDEMSVFAQLRLTRALENFDWVNSPGPFIEQLSAHLWATHQMDAFRSASEAFIGKFYSVTPKEPLPTARLSIAVVGKGVAENRYPLFRKLRREGVYFKRVNPDRGLAAILDAVLARAAKHPVPFAHWYIEGGRPVPIANSPVACVSYDALKPIRVTLQEKMRRMYESPGFGAEALRSMLAKMTPSDLGMRSADGVMERFEVSLLTEGSGTQIYSTTFVQWAAREALRRAQPLTLLVRFAPRERERPMNELLAEAQRTSQLDPAGSLVDADMGAYYTWLNQQRLTGAERSSFLVWFEDHAEAVAIGPKLARGSVEERPVELEGLLHKVEAL